jgi:hypothetical protein
VFFVVSNSLKNMAVNVCTRTGTPVSVPASWLMNRAAWWCR